MQKSDTNYMGKLCHVRKGISIWKLVSIWKLTMGLPASSKSEGSAQFRTVGARNFPAEAACGWTPKELPLHIGDDMHINIQLYLRTDTKLLTVAIYGWYSHK